MELTLNELTPIRVRKNNSKGVTINSSGLYIAKHVADFYGMDETKIVVFFEYTKTTLVLIQFDAIDKVPHTLRQYMTVFQPSLDKDKNVRAYKLHSAELVKKYSKALKVEIEPTTVSGYQAFILNITIPVDAIKGGI